LDEVRPFSDTIGVDVVLRDSEMILSSELEAVGPKNASRIWSFISKFVILDRFLKALGLAEIYPGPSSPRQICSPERLGTASKVGIFRKKKLYYC
jgi:hypothetical protein